MTFMTLGHLDVYQLPVGDEFVSTTVWNEHVDIDLLWSMP
jgi:hypothetical protein